MDYKKVKLFLNSESDAQLLQEEFVSSDKKKTVGSYRLIYQIDGTQSVEFENSVKYFLSPGDILLIPQQKIVKTQNVEPMSNCYLLLLSNEIICEAADSIKAFLHIDLFYPNERILRLPEKTRSATENLLNGIYRELSEHQLGFQEMARKQAELLVILLFRSKEFSMTLSFVKPESSSSKTQLLKVVDYVAKNYSDDLSLELLAKLFFIDKSSISRYFKELSGQNFIDFLNRQRIEAAKELLVNHRKLSVMEVATRVGYNSSTYFERVFRRTQGCTPKEYKKGHNKH